MKHRKIYLIIALLIALLVLVVIFFCISKPNSNKITQNVQKDSSNDLLHTTTLKSTPDNPIEKYGIESTNIEIVNNLCELQIVTTLKNNSNELLDGFFIEIVLLDESGNTITTISENSEQKIEAHGEYSLTNYVAGLTIESNVSNAKIVSLRKNTLKNTMDDAFNSIEEEIGLP